MSLVRVLTTAELSHGEREMLRRLFDAAFEGDFTEHDWQHSLGGWHLLIEEGGQALAHAALVPRLLHVGDRAFAAGYVEAVAVTPRRQRTGLGTLVMTAVNALLPRHFELGALSSGEWGFYERLGWERWHGPTWVRQPDGRLVRSPEDDDGVMVLRCEASRLIDSRSSIACEAREGDSW